MTKYEFSCWDLYAHTLSSYLMHVDSVVGTLFRLISMDYHSELCVAIAFYRPHHLLYNILQCAY